LKCFLRELSNALVEQMLIVVAEKNILGATFQIAACAFRLAEAPEQVISQIAHDVSAFGVEFLELVAIDTGLFQRTLTQRYFSVSSEIVFRKRVTFCLASQKASEAVHG